ncbi:hypothetical protein HZC34_08100 [Candidatus Saganbacteria bacterium]|nr:hypothetical protein [Candidatus Saganbacteria bacterium]
MVIRTNLFRPRPTDGIVKRTLVRVGNFVDRNPAWVKYTTVPLAFASLPAYLHLEMERMAPALNLFPNNADVLVSLSFVFVVAAIKLSQRSGGKIINPIADPNAEIAKLTAELGVLKTDHEALALTASSQSKDIATMTNRNNLLAGENTRLAGQLADLGRQFDAAKSELAVLQSAAGSRSGLPQIPQTGHAEIDALLTAISDTTMRDNIAQLAGDSKWQELSDFLSANDLSKIGIDIAAQNAAVGKVMELLIA